MPESECPNAAAHTPCPPGYIDWHEWARKMLRTHRQKRCPGCSRYAIWVEKYSQPSRVRG